MIKDDTDIPDQRPSLTWIRTPNTNTSKLEEKKNASMESQLNVHYGHTRKTINTSKSNAVLQTINASKSNTVIKI